MEMGYGHIIQLYRQRRMHYCIRFDKLLIIAAIIMSTVMTYAEKQNLSGFSVYNTRHKTTQCKVIFNVTSRCWKSCTEMTMCHVSQSLVEQFMKICRATVVVSREKVLE